MKIDMIYNSESDHIQFNGDILKLIAAMSMLIDHIGAILFPHIMCLRIIGRIAFPIFVFFIAEGCIYTGSRGKYLLNICVFAVITQLVKTVFNDTDDFNVLFTFAVSVAVISVFQNIADSIVQNNKRRTVFTVILFTLLIFFVWFVNRTVVIQYGFWGCIAPFAVYLSRYFKSEYNSLYLKIFFLAAALLAIYLVYGGVQSYAYFAIPLLLCYSGKKGSSVQKYFFYIFYPSHLALLYIIKNII